MGLARKIFWGSVAGLVHTHVTYPLTLAAIARLRERRGTEPARPLSAPELPSVSLIIAAFDEGDVIAAKVADALGLDYPRERLELIVASDGSGDRTVELAREAGADMVLDLPRGGKLATQNAAVERSSGEIVAFSDANSAWEPDALRALVAAFDDPEVGYACGRVEFTDPDGDNEEGVYWRYEMAVRELESELGGITAGNGGIYAVRRAAYRFLAPSRSHDLSFPFALRRDGWRSVDVPGARASRGVCVGFCRVWFRMTVEGLEHVPRSGPFVLAPVHRSNMDTPIVCVVTRRRLRYMGKDSLWKKSFPRWFLSALGGFPVTRGQRGQGGARPLHRRAQERRAARAVPGGRAQVRSARPAAVRRRGLRGRQGQRADRARRGRRLRAGDAQGVQARSTRGRST